MKVILLKDLTKKGKKGDIIEVSDGYGQNYLIKNNYATQLNKQNVYINKTIERKKQKLDENNKNNAIDIFNKINNYEMLIKVKTNTIDKIFGTITSSKIIKILDEQKNVKINKKQLLYFKGINTLGEHNLEIKLYKDIIAKLKLIILKDIKK